MPTALTWFVLSIQPGWRGKDCPDFELDVKIPDNEATALYGEQWQPEGASYYDGELILDPVQRLTLIQRQPLLDTHPQFTGRCPNCDMPVGRSPDGQIHWDCGHCGWADDSV